MIKIVKSRTRKKSSPQISLKKSVKKSPPSKTTKHFEVQGLNNTLLSVKFKYNPNTSDSKRQKSLGNAVVVYDPKGLCEMLLSLSEKNKSNKEISNILKKDIDMVKKNYFKFLK